MTVTEEPRAATPPASRSWLVNAEARVLTTGDTVLIRQNGLVTRCAGAGVLEFVKALLDSAENGRVDLDLSDVDESRLPALERLVAQLVEAGLLIELTESGTREPHRPEVFGLWQRAGGSVDRDEITERLATRPVVVLGTGRLAERIREACAESGLRVLQADADPDLDSAQVVIVGAHEDDPLLTEWNTRAVETGPEHPWLAVLPYDGERATIGPWVVPGESACYRCYRLRRASVFPDLTIAAELSTATAIGPGPDASTRYPGLNLVQAGLVVDRLIEQIGLRGRGWQSVPGGLTTIAVGHNGIATEHHRVLRVPRCPECSPGRGRGYPQVWHGRSVDTGTAGT